MSSKGWVMRKREQFELFAKSGQEQGSPESLVNQGEKEPPKVLSYKPLDAGDVKAEVTIHS